MDEPSTPGTFMRNGKRDRVLVLIAIFKFVKAVLLLAVGFWRDGKSPSSSTSAFG